MKELCGNIEFKKTITNHQLSIIESIFDTVYCDDNTVEIDVRFLGVDSDDLQKLQKDIENDGNEIIAGEIHKWDSCGGDQKYYFNISEKEWISYDHEFLCDIDTETLLEEINRRKKEEEARC